MAISGITDYTNTYAGYTNSANSKRQVTEETGAAKENGSSSTADVAIFPQFLSKMASTPEPEKAYEGYISDMQDLYEQFAARRAAIGWCDCERVLPEEELGHADSQESGTKAEIIVKPDGSRVLVMTINVGGMETAMSLEISKPTEAPNEISKQDTQQQGMKDAVPCGELESLSE